MEARRYTSKFAYLSSFYGIGRVSAIKILGLVELMDHSSYDELSERTEQLREVLTPLNIGYKARRRILKSVLSLKRISCYRGLRSAVGLPIRGQRTHTNAKTLTYLVKTYAYLDLETIREYHSIDIKPTTKIFGKDKPKQRKGRLKKARVKIYDTNLFKNKS